MDAYQQEAPPITLALEQSLSQLVRIAHRYQKHGEHAKAAEVLETVRQLRKKLNLPEPSPAMNQEALTQSDQSMG
jgi:hypothetical protein